MKKIINITVFTALLLCGQLIASDDVVLGVIGMNPVESVSCIAAFVPLERGQALTGIQWFNNDGTVGYPEVAVSGGTSIDPGFFHDAVVVGDDVYGFSSAWSQKLWFDTYRSDSDGVYIIFRLPEASVFVNEGAGGGAAVGYQEREAGLRGWLSLEGEEWISLQQRHGLAFRPILAEADNLKGHLVINLANQMFSAGRHLVTWQGINDQGHEVCSGVYLVRMKAGSFVKSDRLMLVR